MELRAASIFFAFFMLAGGAVALFGCGGSDDEDKKDSGDQSDGGLQKDAALEEEDSGEAPGDEAGTIKDAATATKDSSSKTNVCGNGVVESPEECDDGNVDNADGCNALCEYNCSDDADCDDLNLCNGTETCKDHACIPGKTLKEGQSCGLGRSCWKGICSENICGDGIQQGDEQCDDGNLDPNDGCTPACKFTCASDSDCSSIAGECAGNLSCVENKCVGTPVVDRADCTGGWCIRGECVSKGCGDGTITGTEQCDKGADNGKAGSGCTIDCKDAKCGNGKLEGSEECDDGNISRLDGCDLDCKIELAHRWTKMNVIKTYVPDFCVYQTNRFGDAYSGDDQSVELMPGMPAMTINVLQTVNQRVNTRVTSGDANTIVHVFDSQDTSTQTVDSEIQIGMYDAMPAKKWVEGPPLDFPFYVIPEALNDNRLPKVPIAAEQAGGGRVVSKAPSHIVGQGPTGKFEMYNAMLRYTYDISKLSVPQAHKRFPFSDQVKLPDTMGAGTGDATAATYNPSGIMCGAMTRASQEARLIDDDLAQFCCKTDNTRYRSCSGGKTPPDCDTYADVLKNGCTTVCIDTAAKATSCQAGCGFTIIAPIEPDVDTDKDGTNDSYSSVIAFEGKRVRIAGVAEE